MKTTLRTQGVFLLVFGISLLVNISMVLYFIGKQKKDVLKILKDEKGQERTIPMKVLRAFLSMSPLLTLHSFSQRPSWRNGVTPKFSEINP